MAAAVAGVVLAASMQGDANKNWILDALNKIGISAGFIQQIDYQDYQNEQENTKLNEEKEQEAWEKVREELNIPIIEFLYKPENMLFDKINILKKANEVSLYYWCKEKILHVYIEYGKRNSSASFISMEDASLQDVITNDQKIEIKIWNTTTGSAESYMASFEYQDVLYFISGQLSLEEMEQMMSFMYLY